MYQYLINAVAILLCTSCWLSSASQATESLDVGNKKQLIVDDLFFDQAEYVELKLHPARKTGEHNLVRDRPWESATINWFSLLEHEGKYRMWYECYDIEGWPNVDDTSFCYAESTDGIEWTKPSLKLVEYQGDQDTNILFRQVGPEGAHSRVHGCCVFVDPTAPEESRFKAISQGMFPAPPNYRVAGMHSKDGLRWTRYPEPICNVFADSQYSGFWDSSRQEYFIYGRVGYNGRALGHSSSKDFSKFPELSLVLAPSENDPQPSDLYNSSAIKYPFAENVYFMFPSLFQHEPQTLDIRFAVSRDGIKWSYPEQEKPFIPLGAVGEFDCGSLYMGQGILRNGDELSLYYGGSKLNHAEGELENLIKPDGSRVFSRVTVPLDRFVSAEADAKGGFFVTPPLLFEGNVLKLNAEIHNNGKIQVALLDGEGQPLKNLSIEDCLPLSGNTAEKQVYWKTSGDISTHAGKPVRLRIEFSNASIYAFQFQQGYPYRVK